MSETLRPQVSQAEQRLSAALTRVPSPAADVLHEVRLGRNITAGVALTLEAADLKISGVAHRTVEHVAFVMNDYAKNVDAAPQSMEHPSVTSYETGATLLDGSSLEAAPIGHVAFSYAHLTETGFGDQEGLPRDVLANVDRLLDRAATDSNLQEGLEIIAVSAMRAKLGEETAQMADSLSLSGDPLHDVAHQAHGVVSKVAEGAGIPEGVMAKLGQALGMGEKFAASAIPGGNYAEGQVRKVLKALKDNPAETLAYLTGVVNEYLGTGPETPMSIIHGALFGMSLIEGSDVPRQMNPDIFALAVATRMIQRDFKAIFGPEGASANANLHRLGELAGLTAAFDYHQADGLSLVRAADKAKAQSAPQATQG